MLFSPSAATLFFINEEDGVVVGFFRKANATPMSTLRILSAARCTGVVGGIVVVVLNEQ